MDEKVVKQVDVQVGTPGEEQAKKKLGALAQALKDLNAAGKGAGLTGDGGLIGILKGAGVAVAVKFTADAIRDGAKAWGDYKSGAIGAAEATANLIRAIPILGSILDATFAVLDAVSGKAVSIAQQEKEIAAMNAQRAKHESEARTFEKIRDFAFGINEAKKPIDVPEKLLQLVNDRRRIDTKMEELRARDEYTAYSMRLKGAARMRFFKANPSPARVTMSAAEESALRDADTENRDALKKAQGEFVGKAATGMGNMADEFKDFLRFMGKETGEIAKNYQKLVKENKAALESRQIEIDLEAFRGAAESQKAAEEAFMSPAKLEMDREREKWLKIAADSNVSDALRKKAMEKARNVVGTGQAASSFAPLSESRFLTGVQGPSANLAIVHAQQTAKNTADMTKKLDELPNKFSDALILGFNKIFKVAPPL
jgi:hypothetical protein